MRWAWQTKVRLLIAQAQLADLTIITRDSNIPLYDVAVQPA